MHNAPVPQGRQEGPKELWGADGLGEWCSSQVKPGLCSLLWEQGRIGTLRKLWGDAKLPAGSSACLISSIRDWGGDFTYRSFWHSPALLSQTSDCLSAKYIHWSWCWGREKKRPFEVVFIWWMLRIMKIKTLLLPALAYFLEHCI